nr:hypothetical protein GCM10020093_049850 [Planobispora longispora]
MDAEAGEAGNREGAGNGGARIGGSAGNGGAGDPVADPLRKAVLARTLELSRDEPVDVLDLLRPWPAGTCPSPRRCPAAAPSSAPAPSCSSPAAAGP